MKIRIGVILFLVFSVSTFAQLIPGNRTVNWSNAGYSGNFPAPTRIINVMDLGALGNGIQNDYPAIADALDSLNGLAGVIYFPPGQYRITTPVILSDSVIIRGAASDSSILLFDLQGAPANCISISEIQNPIFYPLTSGSARNSQKLTVSNTSQFSPETGMRSIAANILRCQRCRRSWSVCHRFPSG